MRVVVTHILFLFHAHMIKCTTIGAKSQKINSYSLFFKFLHAKAMVQNSKAAQWENTALIVENVSLHQATLKNSCFTCGGAAVPAENWHLLMENSRLRGEYTQHTHHTHRTMYTFHTRTHVQM